MKLPSAFLTVFYLACTALTAQPNPDSLWQAWNNTALPDAVI